jgi:hypothetical protein
MTSDLPVKFDLAWIYRGSLFVAGVLSAAALHGILNPANAYPAGDLARTFVPNDVVSLALGVPALLGSMAWARRGRLLGLLGWTGALFFIPYNDIAYIMALPLNWVFAAHVVLAAASIYTLIVLLAAVDFEATSRRLRGRVPVRLAGAVMGILGGLFLVRVLALLTQAIAAGAALPATELAVHTADLLITPAWIIGGLLLWRRQAWGYVVGLGLLFQGSMLFLGLLAFLVLQPLLGARPFSAADFVASLVMASMVFVPFGIFVRGVAAA